MKDKKKSKASFTVEGDMLKLWQAPWLRPLSARPGRLFSAATVRAWQLELQTKVREVFIVDIVPGGGPCQGLLLIESAYLRFHT